MVLAEVVNHLDLEICTEPVLDDEVTGGYCSDMLSDVIARAKRGDLWFTVHTHPNIVAVASIVGAAGIVITGGRQPDAMTLIKAREERVPVFRTELPKFEVVGRFYMLLKKQSAFAND